jgi:hypothetical protein
MNKQVAIYKSPVIINYSMAQASINGKLQIRFTLTLTLSLPWERELSSS